MQEAYVNGYWDEEELLSAGYEKDKIKKFAFAFEGKELLIKEG